MLGWIGKTELHFQPDSRKTFGSVGFDSRKNPGWWRGAGPAPMDPFLDFSAFSMDSAMENPITGWDWEGQFTSRPDSRKAFVSIGFDSRKSSG